MGFSRVLLNVATFGAASRVDKVGRTYQALVDTLEDSDRADRMMLKKCMKDDLTKFLYAKTKRKPMILPVIMNI